MASVESSGTEVVTVDVTAAKDLLKSGYGLLDVRTVEEFYEGYIATEKIINIPYMFNSSEGRVKNPQFLEQVLSACKKEDLLVVGCRSGVRSLYAAEDLLNAGFKHVSNMEGGHLAWMENRFPVDKPKPEAQQKSIAEPKPEVKQENLAVKEVL